MSFKEKSAWVTLAVLVVAYGGYFAAYLRGLAAGAPAPDVSAVDERLIATVIGLIVLLIFAHIVMTVLNRMAGEDESSDERDRWIGALGERNGGYVVGVGGVLAMLALLAETAPAHVIHILLAALVAGEIVTQGSKLIYYRRGI